MKAKPSLRAKRVLISGQFLLFASVPGFIPADSPSPHDLADGPCSFAERPVEAEVDERYSRFYTHQVAGRDRHWGTLIPNDLDAGILRVEERSLQTGDPLSFTVAEEPFGATVHAEHGPVPAYTDLGDDPVFLPQGDGFWNMDTNWSSDTFPDGTAERATIHLMSDSDREVSLGENITVGRLVLNNDTSSRNRLAGGGGALTFDDSSTGAHLLIGGIGFGFNELRIEEGIELTGGLRVTVDNVNSVSEFGALRIRESVFGAGGLIKEGFGVLSLTGDNKNYTGPTVVDGGVLRVTESSVPTGHLFHKGKSGRSVASGFSW